MIVFLYKYYGGGDMKKILCFVLCVVLCFTFIGCEKLFEPEERPMTVEELAEFAQMYGQGNFGPDSFRYRLLIATNHNYGSSFDYFIKSIPDLESDICNTVSEEEKKTLGNSYLDYWRYADDVMDRWFEYVDKDSPISTTINSNSGVYYSETDKKYYFWSNTYADEFELIDGVIKGNEATVYTAQQTISLKKSDGKWKLFSFTGYRYDGHSICDRMTRLTGDELESIRQQITNISDELYDGYKDGNWYIIYEEYKKHFVKFENNEYKVITTNYLNHRREKSAAENIYVHEGKYTDMQYTVSENFLPNDESQSTIYNEAIDAYNAFIVKEAKSNLNSYNEENTNQSSMSTQIIDLDKNGIPEIQVYLYPMWPSYIYTYRNGEVVELPGAFSNGQHGGCGLLENGMYRSKHSSTGWNNTFVTYNKNGSQTIERFSEYSTYGYEKYTVGADGTETAKYSIEFEKDDAGKRKFDAMYAPYKEALEHWDRSGEWYSPFVPDLTLDYCPYVRNRIEKYYK